MTPIENKFANRHVERILSLLVILYGLWLVGLNGEGIIRTITHEEIPFVFLISAPLQIIIACCLIIFFSPIVCWSGYFATGEKVRSERRWAIKEITALPLILYAFVHVLSVLSSSLFMVITLVSHGLGEHLHSQIGGAMIVISLLLLYVFMVAVILRYARRIVAWLLWVAD